MKRILMIESRYDSFYGAQKSMVKLIEVLRQQKFNIRVLVTCEGKLKKELEQLYIDVDIIELGKKANNLGEKILSYSLWNKFIVFIEILLFNIRLINYIKLNNIDLIYVNDIRAFTYVVLASKLLRKKSIIYIRTQIKYNLLTKLCLHFVDNIITIAKGVLNDIPVKALKRYNKKIVNIYTGFNFKKYIRHPKEHSRRIFNIKNNEIVIGYVGSINKRKGFDLLIDAYIYLSKKMTNLNLITAGDVSRGHEKYWEDIRGKININKLKVSNIGYVKDISLVYSSIDILVLPSRQEGLPRTVIEGMYFKLPVIATNTGGTKEIIENENIGIIIPINSVSSLSSSLETLINSPKIRKQMGEKAKSYIENKFNEKKYALKVSEFFHKIK